MISFKPLLKLLIDRDIKKTELIQLCNISNATVAKFSNDNEVALKVIDKVCKGLNCQPGDIMEYIPDKE